LRSASFDFNDFLTQFKMLRKMGPLENVLGMLRGMSNVRGRSIDGKQLKRTEAIVLSMTSEERTRPDILNARRRQRIARGSGSTVTEVNDLVRRFDQMRKLMKNAGKMKKMMRSEEHTSELQSHLNLVCRLLLEKKNKKNKHSKTNKHR